MKKIGIITIYDNNNFGNRLQNYALQEVLKRFDYDVLSIKYKREYETGVEYNVKKVLKLLKTFVLARKRIKKIRLFKSFNKNINITSKSYSSKKIKKTKKEYINCFIVGSDQVWNPNFGRLTDIELLRFTNKDKIAYAASFGINSLPEEYNERTKQSLNKFKAISVREDAGKEIIEHLGVSKSVEVLVDPTMLLSAKEWDKVSNKPKQLKEKKYILNYFLGKLPDEWRNEIDRIAKENDCEIINILDENDPIFVSGPSEFLYLEKNAFMVCTDSFHSSVFAIIYNTPFVVFERQDKHVSMNSRLDTLLSKFNLQNRRFNGQITEDLLMCDYTEVKEILEIEKEKSLNFLKDALDIDK